MTHMVSRLTGSLAILFLVAGTASAAPIVTISWTGSTSFDEEEINFAAFTANTLVGIEDTGPDALVHSHNGTQNVAWTMDIFLDGSWTTILSGSLAPFSEQTLADAGLTATFPEGEVSGIRFTSDPPNQPGNEAYHSFGPDTTFSFDTQAIPEPAILLLFASGAALAARRVRRRFAA